MPLRLVSVIIPTRNQAALLPHQLCALGSQTYDGDWELVIADNGSTDQTAAVAQDWADRFPHLRIVDASRRIGVNCARNEGARAARGELLLYCDSDDVVTPGWVEGMVDVARSCDLVGGRIDRQTLNDPVSTAWRTPLQEDRLPIALAFLEYAIGSNFGIWAAVLHEIGGWNEDYCDGCDDIELCWRAQLAGYRIGFATDAVIRYRYRVGLMAHARQSFGYGFAVPLLHRDFRDYGLPRYGLCRYLRELVSLAGGAWHLLRSRRFQGQWMWSAAYWAGRVCGNINHRRRFPTPGTDGLAGMPTSTPWTPTRCSKSSSSEVRRS